MKVRLGVEWPDEAGSNPSGTKHDSLILIYAGSTNAGLFTVEFAERANRTVSLRRRRTPSILSGVKA